MRVFLKKVFLTKTNSVIERSLPPKNIDNNLIENKFESLNLSSILLNNNITELYKDLFNIKYDNINREIFNSIKFKKIGGLKLEVNGRLSKRNRADRSVSKVKWKGGLKNFDSSFKRLSTVNMRGYVESNIEYSIYTSKRKIGSFAV